MGDHIEASKSKGDDTRAKEVADFLDRGAQAEYPNDLESQVHAAGMKLYVAVEQNLEIHAPVKEAKCTPRDYEDSNYGYCNNAGAKVTDRFLELIKKYETKGVGLDLKLIHNKPGWSYEYEAIPSEKK